MLGEKLKSRPVGTPTQDADVLLGSITSPAQTILHYLASFTMTAMATVVAIGVDSRITIPNISLIFVVPVIISAIGFGLGASLSSAILGALAYNFFLTEPRYSLAVDDPANIWAIGLLFVVGIIVSGVAFTSRQRAVEATILRRQATALQAYSRNIMSADGTAAIMSSTAEALQALFRVPAVVMLVEDGKVISLKQVGDIEPCEAEVEAARSSLASNTIVHAGLYPDLASRFDFWPVGTAAGRSAVIGLAFDPDDRPSAPGALVDTIGSILSLVLDRHFRSQQ